MTTRAGSTSGSRRRSSRWPTATRYLTDPAFRDVPVDRLLDPDHAAALAARIDPRRAAHPAAATNPPGGGTIYLAAVDADGQRGEPDRVELHGVRVGRASIRRPASTTTNRGCYFSLDSGPPQRARAGQADAPHAAPRDAVPGRQPGRGSWPARWAAMPSRRSTPSSSSALVDGGVDVADRRRGAALVRRARRSLRSRRSTSASSRATPRASPSAARARVIRLVADRPFDAGSATSMRSSSSTAAPPPRTARSPRPRTRAAPGCPPSGERCGSRAPVRILPAPVAGALTRRRHRSSSRRRAVEERVTSNVGQNYPYSSETTPTGRRRSRASSRARRAWPRRSPRRRRRSTRTTAGGSGSARPRAARASSTPPATRPTSTPCSSSATGPARKTFLR